MEAILNMTIGQIIGGATGIIVLLSIFIEFVPVKINPVSALLGWIGKKTNKELSDKFDVMSKKVDLLEEQYAVNCRVRILRFGDEIRQGIKHSKESFDQVLSDIDAYERYCVEHPEFKNNRTMYTKEKIAEVYSKCIDENSFL